jgi:glycosyltransferase involved in cell wall biosynthesis
VESPLVPQEMPGGLPWPRISIVTPSYNQGHFLEETIRSILLQNYPNLEYFVVDGGSSDQSLEIIERYSPWLSGWISESDRGQSHAINKGFERCSGNLITFQNSDDFYLPGAFEDAARHWAADRAVGLVAGGFYYVDGNHMREKAIPPRLPHCGPLDLVLTQDNWRIHQVSVFYSTQALDQLGRTVREDLVYNMDRELLYRTCRSFKTALSMKPYACFRWHSVGKSESNQFKADMEYADLHFSYFYDNPESQRLKNVIANARRAKALARFARSHGGSVDAIIALIRASSWDPSLFRTSYYYGAWLRALGLRSDNSKSEPSA